MKVLLRVWITPLGIPTHVWSDNGGELNEECSAELEQLGSIILRAASYAPTHNSAAERTGRAWKFHTKSVLDENCLDLADEAKAEF